MAEEVKVKDMLKFQQEKTTIEKDAREVVDPPFADAIRRGIRANKIKEETLKVEPTPERVLNPRLPKMRNGAKEMRLTLDESLFREAKEEDKKLKNESLEENNQEDEELEECEWCHEKYNKSELREEKNLGLLCPTCIDYIESRSEGEDLEFLDESLEEKYFRVSYERKNSDIFVPLVIMVKAENEEQAKEKFHNKYDEEKYETIGITEINEVEFKNWRRKGASLLETKEYINREEDDEIINKLRAEAQEMANRLKKNVVYGYTSKKDPSRFFQLEPKEYNGDDVAFRSRYGANTIYVVYPKTIREEKSLKEGVKVGSKIRIVNMEGEPRYKGKEGVVKEIDDMGQLHGTWGFLAVIPEEDEFEILEEKLEEAHREESDSWEVEELVLYIRNDSEIYDRYTKPTVISLAKKLNKGIFDKELAAKAFLYVVDAGVRKYRKEFKAEDGYEQFRFNPATREDAAKKLLDMEMELIEDKAEDLKGNKEFKEAVEDKKVKFDYALIEFIEGGPSTDTPSEARLRKLKEEKRKFTDLDELGDLIFRADEDVKEFGGPGYDKLYVDFYGKADDGTDVKIHIYRADLGDGEPRENHLTNKDKEEIEEYLTKEYNKLEK